MRKTEEWGCPYPTTCRFRGEGGCLREECPFRIHLRRMVAGEVSRLSKIQNPTVEQSRALALWKSRYARLLAPGKGGGAHGEAASPRKPPGV